MGVGGGMGVVNTNPWSGNGWRAWWYCVGLSWDCHIGTVLSFILKIFLGAAHEGALIMHIVPVDVT